MILNKVEWDNAEKQIRMREHFVRSVQNFFSDEISRPELLNRIGDNIVPFNYILSREVQREIFVSHFERIGREFAYQQRANGHRFTVEEEVIERLVDRYSEQIARDGARGITNALRKEVIRGLARQSLEVEYRNDRDVTFRVVLNGEQIEIETGER